MEKQPPQNEQEIRSLYKDLLESWNKSNAVDFSNLFSSTGNAIGFDGSQMNGKKEIEEELGKVFRNHKVSTYVSIIQEVRSLSNHVYILRAFVGMVPPGKSEIDPRVNAIQTIVAQKENGEFKIAVLQNTPAAFHERPELSKHFTDELQKVFNQLQNGA